MNGNNSESNSGSSELDILEAMDFYSTNQKGDLSNKSKNIHKGDANNIIKNSSSKSTSWIYS